MAVKLTLADLLSPIVLEDWKQTLVKIATTVGLKTENWGEGGYTRTLVALFSQFYKTAGDFIATLAASGFLDTAKGPWLTLLARNVYGVERIEATYAKAPLGLTLTNTGGGLFTFDPGDIVVARGDGKTYRTTSGGTLNAGVGQTRALDLEAEEPGSESNAIVGDLVVMVTTYLGITVTNTVALVGLDEETDEALRQRCRDSIALLSLGGIKKAYEFMARSARRIDGSPVGVTRVRVMPAVGDGSVVVYVAGASGAVTVDDVTAVQAAFDETVTPYGFTATAFSATNVAITAPGTIWIPSALGLSTGEAQQAVYDALSAYVQGIPIGGVVIPPGSGQVFWHLLLAVMARANPGTLRARLTTEADIPIAPGEVGVWSGTLLDTSVILVDG